MMTTKNPPGGGRQSDCICHSTTPPTEPPDFAQAARFLTLLDEAAERWTFQTFDDNKDRKDPTLARVLHGTLEEHWEELCRLIALGAGVFMVVNETNGRGRKTADIVRVRAVFRELDRAGARPLPPGIEPHLVIESSPGKFHEYLLIEGSNRFDLFEGVMQRLVDDYDSDPAAKDRSRVLRLPGFPHQKNPAAPHPVRVRHESGQLPYTWDQVTAALPPKKRTCTASKIPPGKGLEDPDLIRSALAAIQPDCEYQPWLSVGMALHHASGGGMKGFTLWDEWSAQGDSYRDGMTQYKWNTFGNYTGTPATLGTLFHLAQEYGWKRPRQNGGNGHDTEPPADYSNYPEAHESRQGPADKAAGSRKNKRRTKPKIHNSDDLTVMKFPPLRWAIEGILPAGATLFAGLPKKGKSRLTLNVGYAVSSGGYALGKIKVDQGEALYIALDDQKRRILEILKAMSPDGRIPTQCC